VVLEEGVADEGHDVENGVRHDERPHAPGPGVDPAEEQAHDDVADEAAEALVQVVGAADQRRGHHDGRQRPAGLAPPGEEVADHDDLLQHRVLRGRQDQDRHRPPVVGEVGRGDGGVRAEGLGRGVQRQARQAHRSGEGEPAQQVLPWPSEVRPDHVVRVRPVPSQQVQGQGDRHQRQHDPHQLVGQVEPGTVRGHRRVHRRRLLVEGHLLGELVDQLEHGVDRRGAEADPEHQDRLGDQAATRQRGGDGHGVSVAVLAGRFTQGRPAGRAGAATGGPSATAR
jgi:hypothetical protein